MSLLLDDDDVFVPPTKTVKVDVHVTDCDAEVSTARSAKQQTESRPRASAASGVEETASGAAVPTVALFRRGGNGMEKMEALMFGMPRVSVLANGGTPSRARLATQSADYAGTPSTTQRTPLAQKTLQQVSELSSDVRSTISNVTQPKIVSCALSPTTSSASSPSPSMTQHHASSVYADDDVLLVASQASEHGAASTQTSPGKPIALLSASPPARPPEKAVQATTPDATSAQPVKTQMKLSDFFSKMACKR